VVGLSGEQKNYHPPTDLSLAVAASPSSIPTSAPQTTVSSSFYRSNRFGGFRYQVDELIAVHQPTQRNLIAFFPARSWQTMAQTPSAAHGRAPQHQTVPAEHSVLIQSRETGDVIPEEIIRGQVKALPFAKSWVHMMAGGYAPPLTSLASRSLPETWLCGPMDRFANPAAALEA
jgi:hypothetical protein